MIKRLKIITFLILGFLLIAGTPCMLKAALETPPTHIQGSSLFDSAKKISWSAEPSHLQIQPPKQEPTQIQAQPPLPSSSINSSQTQIRTSETLKNSTSDSNLLPAKDLFLSKDKLVVIFMSANCPCSHSHNQEVQQLANEFKDFDFLILHSNPDESAEHAKYYFEHEGFNIPVIQDENLKWANAFHAKKTPHAFVITKNQVLYQGGVSSSNKFQNAEKKLLRVALNEIKNGKKVSEPMGRTLGCAISRDDED